MKAGDRIIIIDDRYGTGGSDGRYFRVGDTGVILETQYRDGKPWQVILKLDRTGDTAYAAPAAFKVTTPHPHATLIAQYAEDAAYTDEPWQLWEYRPADSPRWATMVTHPGWNTAYLYRRRSEPLPTPTRVVNGFTVPAPEVEAPPFATTYWVADTYGEAWATRMAWGGESRHHRALKRGLVFLAEEHAVTNAKAMVGIDPEWSQDKP